MSVVGWPLLPVLEPVSASLDLLSKSQRYRYWLMTTGQLATSILDLLGILLLGLVGLLAAASVSGQHAPAQVTQALARLGIESPSSTALTVTFAASAAVLLLMKTVLYGLLTRSIYKFLGRVHANVASQTASEFSGMPISFVEGRSSQDSAFAVYTGTQAAVLGVLGSLSVVLAEFALLLSVGVALLFIDPVVTALSAVLMGTVAIVSHRWLSSRMADLGALLSDITIETTRSVQEEVTAYRELIVLDRTGFVTQRISKLASLGAGAMAQSQFMVQLPKLIYDVALVVGAAVVTGWLILTKSPEVAIGSLTLFLAAASRVVPSLLRITNQSVSMSHSAGVARPAYKLIDQMRSTGPRTRNGLRELHGHQTSSNDSTPFNPRVVIECASFTYPDRSVPALNSVSLTIEPGTHVALVGRSGAGKSTLADVILGVQIPDRGLVSVSGVSPNEATFRWPGSISYVPQNIALMDGTIRQNVAMALPDDMIEDSLVWEALELAHLASFVRATHGGLATQIGERGVKLSGGQRQRLGLARGLYSRPSLLLMDEATSALDAETEHLVGVTISSLPGGVTRITVAHRLATVRSADQIVYLREGEVAAVGTFAEVWEMVPEFERQALMQGLRST